MFEEEKTIVFGVFIATLIMLLLSGLVVFLVYNYFQVRMRKEKEILKAVFETQEAERNRIAEDLHDDIGGKLSALKLHNELLLSESLPHPAKEMLQKSGGQIDVIVKDIRKIVRNQSSQYLLRNGLAGELRALFANYRNVSQTTLDLAIDELPENLSADFQIAIFRILQELLHNTMKHATASSISLRISASPYYLEVFYADNGIGFPEQQDGQQGMGQNNIRTRANLFNGTVIFSSIPDVETSFTMQFPWKEIKKEFGKEF
jgi:signal transduction histidine kinase